MMKTAFVTGGSRGIGAEAVRAFTKAGYRVAFLYCQSKDAALALARETGAEPYCCDLTNRKQVGEVCQEVKSRFCHTDAFVHSAGIAGQQLLPDMSDEAWRRLFTVHVDSAFWICRELLPAMISRKAGHIVFLSSIWGQVGASMEVAYSAAKAALIGMTRALAKEVGPSGIRVNCVAPGPIRTEMLAGLSLESLQRLVEETPLGRLGFPEEVAQVIVWLCSPDAGFITGQVLGLNGGMVMA